MRVGQRSQYQFSMQNQVIIEIRILNVLGGPGSSKAEQVDSILNKDRFSHVNVGKLLFEQLKGQNRNGVIPGSNGTTKNAQKYFSDWQNGELLNSVKFDLFFELILHTL